MTTPLLRRGRRVGTMPTYTGAGNPALAEITVTVELRPAQHAGHDHGQTVEHGPIPPGAVSLSLYGSRRRGRVDEGGGQIADDLLSPDFRPVDGFTVADAHHLADLWERWHLNECRAWCAHMLHPWAEIEKAAPADLPTRYGRADVVGWALDHLECADGTGYRYGRQWLYEPIPAEILAEILAYFPDPLATRGYDTWGNPTPKAAAR